MVIHPEVIVTPDCPTIKYRQPREQVDLDLELPKVLHAQGWGCGTYFHVQFTSHERDRLLAAALFVVTSSAESIQTSEANPYQPMTKAVYSRKAEQIGAWWYPQNGLTKELEKPADPAGPEKGTVVWNPGRKMHQVKLGDKVIFESADKAEAQAQAG